MAIYIGPHEKLTSLKKHPYQLLSIKRAPPKKVAHDPCTTFGQAEYSYKGYVIDNGRKYISFRLK